ncbi:hypothetical protein FB446DRAFT_705951 [Lentinula raphanica]|nr:hypothetical protein FB446DRAFT_705951 [Lentinula raphanica]
MGYSSDNGDENPRRSNSMFDNANDTKITGGQFNEAGRNLIINNYNETHYDLGEFFEWLGPKAKSFVDHLTDSKDIKPESEPEWILDDSKYQAWKAEGRILCIQGPDDSDKTSLIVRIIQDLQQVEDDPTIVIHYYFDNNDGSGPNSSFGGLLVSFLVQIGIQDGRIHPELETLYESSKNTSSDDSSPDNDDLKKTLKDITADLIRNGCKVYMVIDALDQCEDHEEVQEFCKDMADMNVGIAVSRLHAITDQPVKVLKIVYET